MSIWTCKRVVAAPFAALLLTGCLAIPETGAAPRLGLSRTAPKTVSVARGDVVIGGPPGYCIDRGGSRLRGETAFVLLASCASITQNPEAGSPGSPAILTASVAEQSNAASATEAALDQLERFITSSGGRATLARDGQPGSVEILQTHRESRAVLIRLRDSSTNPAPGLEQTYWRGFFDMNGRLLTISVKSFENYPISAGAGLATLRGFLARIRSETSARNVASATKVLPRVLPRPGKRLFPGLFN